MAIIRIAWKNGEATEGCRRSSVKEAKTCNRNKGQFGFQIEYDRGIRENEKG